MLPGYQLRTKCPSDWTSHQPHETGKHLRAGTENQPLEKAGGQKPLVKSVEAREPAIELPLGDVPHREATQGLDSLADSCQSCLCAVWRAELRHLKDPPQA
jgi:hypothetical protein